MAKLLTFMNKMIKKPSFTINKKLSLLQTSLSSKNESDVMFNKFIQARNFQSDDTAISMLIADKLITFIKSRALKWRMTDFSDLLVSATEKGRINVGLSVDAKRALIEGRGKMKNSGPIIAAVVLKGALLGLLAFKALALLSGKALIVSKLAFLLSSLIGVKKLLTGKQKHVTYEIVGDHHRYDVPFTQTQQKPLTQAGNTPQPSVGGWQRAFDDTLDSFIENFAQKLVKNQ
ncbi:hypothetical protein ACKWTF_011099 [Chironomus riparius]